MRTFTYIEGRGVVPASAANPSVTNWTRRSFAREDELPLFGQWEPPDRPEAELVWGNDIQIHRRRVKRGLRRARARLMKSRRPA